MNVKLEREQAFIYDLEQLLDVPTHIKDLKQTLTTNKRDDEVRRQKISVNEQRIDDLSRVLKETNDMKVTLSKDGTVTGEEIIAHVSAIVSDLKVQMIDTKDFKRLNVDYNSLVE